MQAESTFLVEKDRALHLPESGLHDLLRHTLDKGAPFRFRARGLSMSPFIKDGDVVTIFLENGNLPRLGDVVACCQPSTGRLVVHRVVGKREGSHFLTKGDNIPEVDGWVPRADILGHVRRVDRKGRRVYLGLGPERILIAFVTRYRLLLVLLLPFWRLIRPIMKGKDL